MCTGNKYLHLLTKKRHRVAVDVETFTGESKSVDYDNFTVASEDEKFKVLSIGDGGGSAG